MMLPSALTHETARAWLEAYLKEKLSLDDWGVTVVSRKDYVAVESRQTLLEPTVADAVSRAARRVVDCGSWDGR